MAPFFSRMLLLGLGLSFLASADEIPISVSTTGAFSYGTGPGLTFAGIGSTGSSGFDDITVQGALALPNLGTFTLQRPAQGADAYNNDFFVLSLAFFAPYGVIGKTSFNADIQGVANKNKASIWIHFGPTQAFQFENASASGGFKLSIDDLFLEIPDGFDSASQIMKGTITDAYDPPIALSSVPEPISIVLLGSVVLLVSERIRRQSRTI
jgi:hypothetical protein